MADAETTPTTPSTGAPLRATPGQPVQNLGETVRATAGQEPVGLPGGAGQVGELDKDGKAVKPAGEEATTNEETPDDKSPPEKTDGDTPPADPRFEPYTTAFTAAGDLSEEMREKAVKDFGVPREAVDIYVEGLKAQVQLAQGSEAKATEDAVVASVEGAVGGKENWTGFSEWANANLAKEDMAALIAGINSNNPKVAAAVVKEHYESFKASGGGQPRDVTAGLAGAAGAGQGGFSSKEEQHAAIRDPRYKTDEAYRKGVESRIAQTNF